MTEPSQRGPHMDAYRWVKSLPIDPGAKVTLQALWDHAPYVAGPASHADVYPTRATLARDTGQSEDAVKKQVERLTKLGWVRRVGRGYDLAWLTPWDFSGLNDADGYVYALEFSSGVVKVGQSSDPANRVGTHITTAANLGLDVVRQWVSKRMPAARHCEARMINALASAHARAGGVEWFHGGFDLAVSTASEVAP